MRWPYPRRRRNPKKIKLLRKLLAKDPFMPTPRIWEAISKKFGKGLPEKTIHKVRANRFGVKIGPRGVILNAAGKPRRCYLSDLNGSIHGLRRWGLTFSQSRERLQRRSGSKQ